MTEKRRIYNRIKVMLVEKRKSNLELAEHLKKDKNTVSRYMRNEIQPPLSVLFDIADFLNCEVKDLLVSNTQPPTYIED